MLNFYFQQQYLNDDKIEHLVYLISKNNIENKSICIPNTNIEISFNTKDELSEAIPIGLRKYLHICKYKNDDKNNIIKDIAKIINKIAKSDNPKITILIDDYDNDKNFLRQIIDGIFLGTYRFDKYISKQKQNVFDVNFANISKEKLEDIIYISKIIYDSVKFARDLANDTAEALTPKSFVEVASQILNQSCENIEIEIYNHHKLKEKGLNGILTVGKGSANKPFLLIATYNGDKNNDKIYTLVGKGITFDSGGYSIKDTDNMLEMKADMSGAAVALSTMVAVAKLKLPINLKIYIPLAENLISGNSYKPSDIIKMYNGKTVEVVNTDAEGRLILADALTLACEDKPELIIDLATLTGAVVIALGMNYAGVFSNNQKYLEHLKNISQQTNEKIWELPLAKEYNELLKSKIADIKNIGSKCGGAITAALFLNHFFNNQTNWIHLDIAGPSFPNEFGPNTKDTMTGFGVRLLVYFLLDLANQKED